MLRSSQPSFSASSRVPCMPASSSPSFSLNFPRLKKLPSADPVSGLARPQPSPLAVNPLLRSKVTPASPSSDPGFPQLLSLELLPSFHFRAVPGPGASPLPISGPPIPFPGNPCRLHTPHLHFRPPTFSLPRRPPSSKTHFRPPPTPAGLSKTRKPYPGSVKGPPHCGGPKWGTQRPPAPHPLPPGPGPGLLGRGLPQAPRPSTPSPVLPRAQSRRREQAEQEPNRGDDTTGLPGTFCSSSSPPPTPSPSNPSAQPPPP